MLAFNHQILLDQKGPNNQGQYWPWVKGHQNEGNYLIVKR